VTQGSARGLILIRTHFVDDRLAETARRYAASDDYDVMFAVDETLGPIECREFAKLSLSLDSCARLGLLVSIDKPLWRCGDYVFYHALDVAQRYRFVWSIEYDVVVNYTDPLDFFRHFDARAQEQVLCADLQVAAPDWWWRRITARRFGVVYMALFPLVRMTPSAIAALYARRKFESRRVQAIDAAHDEHWPNDEGFVASYAHEIGMPIADFNAYGDFYTHETFAQKLLLHASDVPPPDHRLYHAVRYGVTYLSGCRSYYKSDLLRLLELDEAEFPSAEVTVVLTELLARRLAQVPDDPRRLFGDGGALAAFAPHFARPSVASALLRALGRARMRVTLETIQAGRLGVDVAATPEHDNVALGRIAWQSSLSARARGRSHRLDAEGGNDGDLSVEYGFHTASQPGPWWAVDLAAHYPVRSVRLFNRKLAERKFQGFVLEASTDFVEWRPLYAHEQRDRDLLYAEPIEIALETPVEARYVRVRLPHVGVLHLVEVEVYRAASVNSGV
jgi:hypothetical protein